MPAVAALTRTLTVLALTGALLAVPVGAEAGSRTHTDPRGDMITHTRASAPDQVNGDILKVRMRHTHSRVQVRITLADLARGDTIINATHVAVLTNEGARRYVNTAAWAGHWAGEVSMQRDDGKPVRCSIHQSNNCVKNVIVIGFSRRCVSRPRWVRIATMTTTAVSSGDGMGWPPSFNDDGLRNGKVGISGKLSPRIRRG